MSLQASYLTVQGFIFLRMVIAACANDQTTTTASINIAIQNAASVLGLR